MNNPKTPDEEAALWLIRRSKGFSEKEEAAFNAWKALSPAHQAALKQMENAMETVDGIGHSRLRALFPSPRPRPRLRQPLLIACTVLALVGAGLWWQKEKATKPLYA